MQQKYGSMSIVMALKLAVNLLLAGRQGRLFFLKSLSVFCVKKKYHFSYHRTESTPIYKNSYFTNKKNFIRSLIGSPFYLSPKYFHQYCSKNQKDAKNYKGDR